MRGETVLDEDSHDATRDARQVVTDAVADTAEDALEIQAPTQLWWARFGTFIFDDHTPDDLADLRPKLAEQLKKDLRVTRAMPISGRTFWDSIDTFYPPIVNDDDDLLSGADHVHAAQFGNPIVFTVHVPAKNQPEVNGHSATVEDYQVAWDGWTAVVAWRRVPSEVVPPIAAGQVIVDVLRDALAALDSSLMVQACIPGCHHLFAHTDMKVSVQKAEGHRIEWGPSNSTMSVDVRIQSEHVDDYGLAYQLQSEIAIAAETFALMKNLARRILNLEQSARSKTAMLLRYEYAALERADVGFWKRIGHGFQDAWLSLMGRGRGRPAKRLIAELWLQMAAIESLQVAFRDARRNHADSIDSPALQALFEADLKADEAGVDEIDASFARAAIESKSARLDTRVVVAATLAAAVVGSAIGAAIGGVLT